MKQVISELQALEAGELRINEPMSHHTTWKIGGPADVLVTPRGKEELAAVIRLLHRTGTPWTLIGRGSNMLVSDKGIRGAAIKLGDQLKDVRFEGTRIHAGASCSVITLANMAARQGLTGLEFAGGIPGTVGGAVYMNAGAHGSDLSRVLTAAEILLETGEFAILGKEQLQFAYRHSVLQSRPGIVTEAVLDLDWGDRREIAATMASFKDRRRKTQPLKQATAGSVFRNPEPQFAAKLIQDAGLKGTRIGGAEVSPLHANFIVNTGQATAQDVLALMERVKKTVFERFGVQLIPEVLVVGER